MSKLSIVMSAAVEAGMRASTANFAEAVIRQLGEEGVLTCGVDKALGLFDFESSFTVSKRSVAAKKVRAKQAAASSKAAGTAKPETLLPFCGVIVEDWCKGVRFNHGLHTQCTNASKGERYCKTCTKSATSSASGKPTYGDIDDRATEGVDYRDPKGKRTLPFANVAEKLSLSIEAAKEAATKMGWSIPGPQLVKRKVQRGRPAKSAAASDTSSNASSKKSVKVKRSKKAKVAVKSQKDLIATLVASAATEVLATSKPSKAEKEAAKQAKIDAKAAKLAEKEAAKQAKIDAKAAKLAEKEAAKQAKEDAKAAKLAEKEAAKQAKVDAKAAELAEKEAAKATKLAEKEAAKAAKLAEKEAAKATKLAEKEAAKAAKLAEKEAAKATKLAEKEAAKLEAKAAKVQTKVDGIVEEILSYVALNKLNAADEEALRKRVKEVDEHCTGSLTTGVTMKGMKDILKSQKKLQRSMAKKVAKKAASDDVLATMDAVSAELEAEAVETEEEEEEEELNLTPEMIVEINGVKFFKVDHYAGYDNFLFTLEGEMFGIWDSTTGEITEVEEE